MEINPNEQQIAEKLKLTREERRQRWNEAKKEKRRQLEEFYRYAPWNIRVWNLYLKKPVCWILALCLIAGLIIGPVSSLLFGIFTGAARDYYLSTKNLELSEKDKPKIYEMSPLDTAGSERIDAMPAYGKDETWTIFMYIVGSNLEDQDENDLSPLTKVQIDAAAKNYAEKDKAATKRTLERFGSELSAQNLELPAYFYYPVKPVASSTIVTEDVVVETRLGSASGDIAEISSQKWSDNIRIVIQTGGAKHWSNHRINPNRTQRFLYQNGLLTEIDNLPLQPAAETDTLADFLKFTNNYRSDHNMLVLWDHGGGPFGYGMDSIYGKLFSLREIHDAFVKAFGEEPEKAPFDIIGFDACFMSGIETTHTLNGYADYYCVSEESEPGDGWYYSRFLKEMTENPTMNAPQVGRAIADSYTDYYMTENLNVGFFNIWNTTFSVLDAKKAEELYQAYCDLCKAQLVDAVADMGVLAEIGRCANQSTRYGAEHSNIYNISDLGNYADQMAANYPDECKRIKDLVGETVLYHRENGSLCDSTGITVYIPSMIDQYYSLDYYLEYVYDICEDDNVRALYYYKQAGCLNNELSGYVSNLTDAQPKKLNVKLFTEFTKAEPTIEEHGFSLPVSDELAGLVVGQRLDFAMLDEENETITDLGSNGGLKLDGQGHLVSDFDGRWPHIDGEPLSIEIASESDSAIEYRAHVKYNGKEAYLILAYDRESGELNISGVRKVEQNDPNYLYNTRSYSALEEGATIIPLYNETYYRKDAVRTVEGKAITIKKKTKVEMKPLSKGYYLGTVVITDPRGDSYYSAVLGADIGGGKIKEWKIEDRFLGSGY